MGGLITHVWCPSIEINFRRNTWACSRAMKWLDFQQVMSTRGHGVTRRVLLILGLVSHWDSTKRRRMFIVSWIRIYHNISPTCILLANPLPKETVLHSISIIIQTCIWGKSLDTSQSGLFHADPLPKLPKGPLTRDSKPAETKFLHDATLPGRGAGPTMKNLLEDWLSCKVFSVILKPLHFLLNHSANGLWPCQLSTLWLSTFPTSLSKPWKISP